jgi:ribosomal-protein-alanine N-acetyltransferase
MVAEQATHEAYGQIVGFNIYELHKNRLHILRFATLPAYQRRGVGAAMVRKLVGKLTPNRCRIMLEIRESNVDAQLFFKAMGFRAVSLLRDFYDDTPEDAYLMQFKLEQKQPA